MDWPLVVAFLLSGFAGAVLGVVVTTLQHRNDENRADRGAARVVYFELAENTSYLTTAIQNSVTMPVKLATWPANRNRLANLLAPGDFAIVATAFMKLAATEGGWALRLPGSPQSPDGVQATREVLERVEAAAAALYPVAWPKDSDRGALDTQLREHVEKMPTREP